MNKSKETTARKIKRRRVVKKKIRKNKQKKRKQAPSSELDLYNSKDMKNNSKIIELGNSISVLEENTPMISRNQSSENINDFLLENATDSKDLASKESLIFSEL